MGYNTTVVILNDGLGQISKDADFGRNLSDAILRLPSQGEQTVSAGNHGNPCIAIETHHADMKAIVAVGGNDGEVLGHAHYSATRLDILRMLAEKEGYSLRKKPAPSKRDAA